MRSYLAESRVKEKEERIVNTGVKDTIMKINEMEEPGLEERVNSITDIGECIIMIKRYKKIMRTQN